FYNEDYQNPYMLIDVGRDVTESSRLYSSVRFEYEFTDWFSASYNLYGTFFKERNFMRRDAITYNPEIAPSRTGSNTPASFTEGISYNERIISDLFLNFDRDFGEDFNARLILGNSVETYKSHGVSIGGNDLFVPKLYNADVRRGELSGSNATFNSARAGYLADLTVGFRDFLFVNGAFRYDQSSTLPVDNNSFNFYNVGASAVLTKAIPNLKGDVLNFLK